MKIIIKNIKENPVTLFRRAGYVFKKKEKDYLSFVRSFGKNGYPRFHIFAYPKNKELVIYLHFDQKKETYGEAKRHHGEYENSQMLRKEMERIEKIIT